MSRKKKNRNRERRELPTPTPAASIGWSLKGFLVATALVLTVAIILTVLEGVKTALLPGADGPR